MCIIQETVEVAIHLLVLYAIIGLMIKLNPTLHTPEALAAQVSEIYASDPDALLIGSLGRAILYGETYGDPLYEFRTRGERPEGYGIKARDIDLVSSKQDDELPQGPFCTDTVAFKNPSVSIRKVGSDWVLASLKRGFEEVINPATMDPTVGTSILDIPGQTIPCQTQLALYHCRGGPLRRKDNLPIAMLRHLCTYTGMSLPKELYDPFNKLAELKMDRKEAAIRMIYQRLLPPSIETRIDYLLTR